MFLQAFLHNPLPVIVLLFWSSIKYPQSVPLCSVLESLSSQISLTY